MDEPLALRFAVALGLGSPELRRLTLPVSGLLFAAGALAAVLI
jgi:hypothetical protein